MECDLGGGGEEGGWRWEGDGFLCGTVLCNYTKCLISEQFSGKQPLEKKFGLLLNERLIRGTSRGSVYNANDFGVVRGGCEGGVDWHTPLRQ